MSDGAHQGISADRALKTILGGEDQPTEDEKQTPEQMLDAIRSQEFDNLDYGTTALAVARIMLEAFEAYPELRDIPVEREYLKDGSGQMVWPAVHLTAGLYDALEELHSDDKTKTKVLSDITGFMWGWAVNAVRYALGDPPKPNPALMEIG